MSSLDPSETDDIVSRLRREQEIRQSGMSIARSRARAHEYQQEEWVRDLVRDAADEIERLRRESGKKG